MRYLDPIPEYPITGRSLHSAEDLKFTLADPEATVQLLEDWLDPPGLRDITTIRVASLAFFDDYKLYAVTYRGEAPLNNTRLLLHRNGDALPLNWSNEPIYEAVRRSMNTVGENLAQKIGVAIDAVPFAAAGGVAGVPKPLTGMTGVNTASGASYTLATGMSAITASGDALLESARPGFAANRNVASMLRQRQEFAASPLTLWRGALTAGELHDFPAFSTSNIPAACAFFGNWAYLILCDFSGGLDVEVNPFANFQTGIVGLSIFATIDLAPIWPGAFTVINGIS